MKQLSPANRAANMGVSEGLAADPVLRGRAVAEGELGEHLHACVCVCVCIIYPSFVLWESYGDSLSISYQAVLISLSEFLWDPSGHD